MRPFIVKAAAAIGDIAALIFDRLKEEESRKRLLDSGILEVDAMTGKEFEKFLAVHFEKLGYNVTLTQESQDYGADLFCTKMALKLWFKPKEAKIQLGLKQFKK